MEFIRLEKENDLKIKEMSEMASAIVKDYYDPISGPEQNDYMIALFQSVEGITDQLNHGYRYYFVKESDNNLGFIAFYPKEDYMYLSKFYLYKEQRGKGYGRAVFNFLIEETRREGLNRIELNVNKQNETCKIYEKLGLERIRAEKNDIGNGFYMDDYVYSFTI